MLKVGVIGVGSMGYNHARVYYEIPGVKLVGVVDTDKKRAEEVASKYGATAYETPKDLIGKVDAVTVAVPTSFHKDITNLFLKNGIDVLVEKPMAIDIKEADEMIKTAEDNSRILMVGHIERFNPVMDSLKEIIKNNGVQEISTTRRNPFVSRIKDCGVTQDIMIHDIDVVRYLTGKEPEIEYVKGGSVKSDYDDWSKVILRYGNIPAVHMADRRTERKIRSIEINCEDKLIEASYLRQEIKIYSRAKPVYGSKPFFSEKVETIQPRGEPLKIELEEFINCVRERRQPVVDGEEGKKNLKVVRNILEMMKK